MEKNIEIKEKKEEALCKFTLLEDEMKVFYHYDMNHLEDEVLPKMKFKIEKRGNNRERIITKYIEGNFFYLTNKKKDELDLQKVKDKVIEKFYELSLTTMEKLKEEKEDLEDQLSENKDATINLCIEYSNLKDKVNAYKKFIKKSGIDKLKKKIDKLSEEKEELEQDFNGLKEDVKELFNIPKDYELLKVVENIDNDKKIADGIQWSCLPNFAFLIRKKKEFKEIGTQTEKGFPIVEKKKTVIKEKELKSRKRRNEKEWLERQKQFLNKLSRANEKKCFNNNLKKQKFNGKWLDCF